MGFRNLEWLFPIVKQAPSRSHAPPKPAKNNPPMQRPTVRAVSGFPVGTDVGIISRKFW